MKNVCKKLFSLMLAAVLLVSIVPFQAMADETDPAPVVPVKVYINGEYVSDKEFKLTEEGVVLDEAFALSLLRETAGRTLDKWMDNVTGDVTGNTLRNNEWFQEQTDYALEMYLNEGDTTPPTTEPTPPPTTEPTPPPTTEPAAKSKTITLLAPNGKTASTTITEGKVVDLLPVPDLQWHKKFVGWFDEYNRELKAGVMVNTLGEYSDTYTAKYNEVPGSEDGLSKLLVKVALYSGGKRVSTFDLADWTLTDGTKILEWLINNKSDIMTKIANTKLAEGYQWTNEFFYNYDGSGNLTAQDVLNNGDKTVYIKLNAKESTESKILLYVHTKLSDTTPKLYEITGYVKNGQVTRNEVLSVIKSHYTGSNMKLDGLYSAETWKQKVGGQNPTGVESLTITNNDIYAVHVILTNATLKNSSNADSSNPKTGDSIMITVTVMAVSATCLAAAYLLNKKRMVK